MSTGQLHLILGGARSGKSSYAEQWARERGGAVLFVATAQAYDEEMRQRIARHRADRPAEWQTVEAPLQVAQALEAHLAQHSYQTIVLDCLTLLASNILLSLPETAEQDAVTAAILREVQALLQLQQGSQAAWLIVSNEVGMGVVPPTRLGRFFRDGLGRANQMVAQAADEVSLLVAGIAWQLKSARSAPEAS